MPLCHFDCVWYLGIATGGYDTATHDVGGFMQANWAFFPVYPLGVRLAGATPLAGMIVSGAAFWALLMLGARYRAVTRGETSPWSWLLLVLAWPYSFYFDIQYSESNLRRDRAGLPARPGHGATLACRSRGRAADGPRGPTGILLAACVGLRQLWMLRRSRTGRSAVAILAPSRRGADRAGPVSWFSCGGTLGDPLAFAHIQTSWHHSLSSPLTVLLDAVKAANPHGGHPGLLYDVGWALIGARPRRLAARPPPAGRGPG